MGKTGGQAVIFHLPHPLPGADRVIGCPQPCAVGLTLSLCLAKGDFLKPVGLRKDSVAHGVGQI